MHANKARKSARTRSLLLSLATAGVALCSSAAHAYVSCEGPVSYLAVGSNGSVYVNVGSNVWPLCGLASSFSAGGVTITQDVCRAWYATFLAAQKSGGSIRLYFNDPSPACAAIGAWVIPNPLPYHMDSLN